MIGKDAYIADDVVVDVTGVFQVGNHARIESGTRIKCLGDFILGDFSILGSNTTIECNNFKSGDWLFASDGFTVGAGGKFNNTSNVTIGDGVGIFENVLINPDHPVTIGDGCGVGRDTQIWTHGAWLSVLDGFPTDFGPVEIGNNVWLTPGCTILPNVTIGDNVVFGIKSLINKNIPSGCLAVGHPVSVVKENAYPRELSDDERVSIIKKLNNKWLSLLAFKHSRLSHPWWMPDDIQVDERHLPDELSIRIKQYETHFNLSYKTMDGDDNEVVQDYRDFLRRNGIKIYTNKHFKSI